MAKEASEKASDLFPSTLAAPLALALKAHESPAVPQKFELPNRLATYPVRFPRARRVHWYPFADSKPPFTFPKKTVNPDLPPALPSTSAPGQRVRLPGQSRVTPDEYREFLALGHGEIFNLDVDL